MKILKLAFLPINESFQLIFWLRLAQHKNPLHGLARFVYWFLSSKHQVHLSRHSKIGYAFKISHLTPMVINWKTEFGDNCTVFQFCSIGSSTGGAAKIGNNVYIGPHTSIVGEVQIGDNVTIGAGAVVTKDIPSNATVAGVPAKIISMEPKNLVIHKWHL
ncbi:MAG: serine acetyltransferase [Bacteroidales bacterium]|nr:serine acetyltransferase [Bacteroidales bacterium]